MIARVSYAVLAIALVTLAGIFAVRLLRGRPQALPVVETPPEVAGKSCEEGIETARALTKSAALDRARLVYLWLISHCDSSPVLPQALLEAGSLFGVLRYEPDDARLAYEQFLQRFPTHPDAGDVTYHLARLQIERGDYTAAVGLLTTLAQRYPNSWHEESGKFLAARAAEMLAAEQRSRRTVFGQLAQLVPNNLVSLLALFTALGPSVIQTVSKARQQSSNTPPRSGWMMPVVIIGLTFLNFVVNNVDSSKRNRMLMEKLDRLAAVGTQSRQSP